MAHGYRLEATYESGYRLIEAPEDLNPYGGGNTLTAIFNFEPTKHGHGNMTRFALVPEAGGEGLAVDWTEMSVDAVPVRCMRRSVLLIDGVVAGDPGCESIWFGYYILGTAGQPILDETGLPILDAGGKPILDNGEIHKIGMVSV